MKQLHPCTRRVTCDCGNPVPFNPDGSPKFKSSKDAICERCNTIQKEWKWSRYNPDCLAEGDGVAKNGIAWTAWGNIAYVPLIISERARKSRH